MGTVKRKRPIEKAPPVEKQRSVGRDIARVTLELDIVDVASRYVVLQKSGRSFKALCPFHSETMPSFYVFPEHQNWHCFGCGLGGDILDLVMKKENLDLGQAALHLLADRSGVPLAKKKATIARRKPTTFDSDAHYYEEHLPEFLTKYKDKYIAIVNKAVVDSDDDFSDLAKRVFRQYGCRDIFMPRVTGEQRIAHIPTPFFPLQKKLGRQESGGQEGPAGETTLGVLADHVVRQPSRKKSGKKQSQSAGSYESGERVAPDPPDYVTRHTLTGSSDIAWLEEFLRRFPDFDHGWSQQAQEHWHLGFQSMFRSISDSHRGPGKQDVPSA